MNLPDHVFWAELEEIRALRKSRRNAAAESSEPAAFREAVDAAEKVRLAMQQVRTAEENVSWLARRRLGIAERVAGLPGGTRLSQALESEADRVAVEAVGQAEKDRDDARATAGRVACPSCDLGLVGLALSGGGIRSATFNLGVLQAFAKHGLLNCVDYLSSVSGGGYIGGTLSSLLSDPEANAVSPDFPLRHDRGRVESPAMKHLRRGASYLAPGGVVDMIRIPALALRGLLVNLLLLLPYLLWAMVVTHFVWGDELERAYREDSLDLEASQRIVGGYWLTLVLAGILGLWALLFPLIRRVVPLRWAARNIAERLFALFFAFVVTMALVSTLPLAVFYYEKKEFLRSLVASGWLGTFVAIVVPLLPLLLASGTPRVLETWRGRLMVYALGLLGPAILLLLYLELASWRIFHPSTKLTNELCLDPGWRAACAAWWSTIVDTVEHLLVATSLGLGVLDWALVILGGVLFFYGWYAVDVNITALHGFYRDRISRAYLFRARRDARTATDDIVPEDELQLSGLGPAGSRAPYHLVNATVNLQASREASGRGADFFLFSKRFVGSMLTTYCGTTDMERVDTRLDLGTAVAISGAALAPNMGSATNRTLVFVMTLLNVRTGYWLPNPRKVTGGSTTFRGVGPAFLLRELFGLLNENSRYVNVSDGGHIENLGLHELLRRRCKYIIVCDAEADAKLTFGGLAKVMQYARIDASIEIDLDLDRLRMDASGRSQSHWALGRIRYDSGQDGYLLYLKASFTGDETEDVRAYRAQNPDFPHEPTSQQFFKEGQFETYRALGYHIADEVVGNQRFDGARSEGIEAWFKDLAQRGERDVNAVG